MALKLDYGLDAEDEIAALRESIDLLRSEIESLREHVTNLACSLQEARAAIGLILT